LSKSQQKTLRKHLEFPKISALSQKTKKAVEKIFKKTKTKFTNPAKFSASFEAEKRQRKNQQKMSNL
jgi:hypothetical protein